MNCRYHSKVTKAVQSIGGGVMRPSALILFLASLSGHVFSQKKDNQKVKGPSHLHIRLLAKAYEDSVVLRWAPENAIAWSIAKDSGYHISRLDYSDPKNPISTDLTTVPFKPMTLEQMKANLEKNNKYAAIAAQAMYGNDFRMTKEEPVAFAKKVKQEHDAMNFRYSFAMQAADFSAPVAGALALRWVDRNVKKGNRYIYVITVPATGKNYKIDSAASYITNLKETINHSPEGLKAFGFDRQVELHWNRKQAGNYSAYYIERSEDGKTFEVLTKLPYYSPAQNRLPGTKDSTRKKIAFLLRDHQVYFDSIPQDYKTYYYRVRGINAFAELSSYSPVVSIQGRDLSAPIAPVIDSAKNTGGADIKISWTQRAGSPDLAGYYISRGTSVKGPFYPLTKTLLDRNTRSYTDTAAIAHLPNYYVVVAADTAKNLSASAAFPGYIFDTTAPLAPSGVTGHIDSNGVAHLHWEQNREADLKGYKVYYAYNPRYEFSQLTKEAIPGNDFTDTISMKSLNRVIYYEVVAVDRSNNHSLYSAPAALKKPVVVPPSAPVAGTISVAKSKAVIEWIQSHSDGASGYEIFRRENGKDWIPVSKLKQDWNKRSLYFTDSGIAVNTDYYYSAETIDSTGERSPRSVAVHVNYHAVDTLAAPSNLKAQMNLKKHNIGLSWQYKDSGDYFFVVYRSVNEGALEPWQSFDRSIQSGEDNDIKKGTYRYAIKVVHRDKSGVSLLGKQVSVNVSE